MAGTKSIIADIVGKVPIVIPLIAYSTHMYSIFSHFVLVACTIIKTPKPAGKFTRGFSDNILMK
jgi:hypothetical protein